MSAAVTKAGPYYSSGSISFSSLRTNFKEASSGSISASELRRNTTTTNTNPVVPDATENAGISVSSNIKLSQFRGSIKYYYVTQTGTDTNFDIDAQSWNSNLTKNIRKWMYVNGTCGSNSISSSAADFNATAYNVTIDVSGNIYGCGGAGGTSATISGGSGGTALTMASSGGNNIVVFVRSGAQIYGGGGGGEKGSTGANGSSGTCVNTTETAGCGGAPGCPSGYYQTGYNGNCGGCCQTYSCGWGGTCCSQNRQCRYCRQEYTVSGGIGGEGGNGGPGRGYNNLSGSLSGSGGAAGGANNGCGSTNGATGETGGSGGEWGVSGGNTTNTGNGGSPGRAISGSNYSVTGTINSSTIKGAYNP
jgi:hypothetical protein